MRRKVRHLEAILVTQLLLFIASYVRSNSDAVYCGFRAVLCPFDASFETVCVSTPLNSLDLLEKTLLALGVRTVQSVQLRLVAVVIIHYRCSQRGQTCISICDGVRSFFTKCSISRWDVGLLLRFAQQYP
jgi:hypothetical protein